MSGWDITATVPPAWSDLCERNRSVFQSEQWMVLLERSFGCRSTYFLRDDGQQGFAISHFPAGPFRIGYIGFPVGGMIGGGAPDGELLDLLRQKCGARMPVAVRIPVSGFGEPTNFDLPYEPTAETAIGDLQSWTLDQATTNRRRDVRRSLRSSLQLVDANDPTNAERIYHLYRKTIERNDGSLRYNVAYFEELIRLAQWYPGIRVLLAMRGESIAAFTVVAIHGSVGYYLHGAIDWSLRQDRPAAMLMNAAIEWAKIEGCESFSFLSSPPAQESLITYKEGWGAQTREHHTFTLPTSSMYSLFHVVERLYRKLR